MASTATMIVEKHSVQHRVLSRLRERVIADSPSLEAHAQGDLTWKDFRLEVLHPLDIAGLIAGEGTNSYMLTHSGRRIVAEFEDVPTEVVPPRQTFFEGTYTEPKPSVREGSLTAYRLKSHGVQT